MKRQGNGPVEGDRHPAAKLTARVVEQLRLKAALVTTYREGFVTDAARKHRVTPAAISNALTGATWKCAGGPILKTKLNDRKKLPLKHTCPAGHDMTGENVRWWNRCDRPKPRRVCVSCEKKRRRDDAAA